MKYYLIVGETSGELKIKIIDSEPAKNTSIVLDKTDTIKSYQEEFSSYVERYMDI